MCSCAHNHSKVDGMPGSTESESKIPEIAIGKWTNLYKGDPQLAGVELSQCIREGPTMRDDSIYYGKHPAEVAYHFWDGRIRWIMFYPDGKKMGDQWLNHYDIMKFSRRDDPAGYVELKRIRGEENGKYISSWGSVDFSFGSDPQFKRHKNPIRVIDDAIEAYSKRLSMRKS